MKYNTDINIIGSIPDYHLIFKAMPLLMDTEGNGPSELKKILVTDNEFSFRTEGSRRRFLRVLNSTFVYQNHEINLFGSKVIELLSDNETSQSLVFFWLFSLNNKLFYEINRDVFLKFYFLGRAELPKSDIIAYLKDKFNNNPDMKGLWSEKTIDVIARKYLATLTRLQLLEGVKRKSYCFVRVSDELLVILLYLMYFRNDRELNVLNDEFLNFSFIAKESIIERLKRIGKKDWMKMNFTGTGITIEPLFDINNLANVIFRRKQSEI